MGRAEATDLLRKLGAVETAHPGGNLFDHLIRVEKLLGDWGARPYVCSAGLLHALYVSAGSPDPYYTMIDLAERPEVARIIGSEAEELVYLYGASDLGYFYPRVAENTKQWRDRFTGEIRTLTEGNIREFMEITVANELDIAGHDTEVVQDPHPELLSLVSLAQPFLSAAARRHCARVLGRRSPFA